MQNNFPRNFLDYSSDELSLLFEQQSIPRFRAKQLRRWVYFRKTDDLFQMSDISKEDQQLLNELFALNPCASNSSIQPSSHKSGSLFHGTIINKSGTEDGTEKLLLEFPDGHRVESVLLRDDRNHRTACISTQVGCAMGCLFCASGLDGFVRNLTKGEILEQILRLNALLPCNERLTHLVVMGTGEPTLNLSALLSALEEITSQDGLDLGNRKITISTVGNPEGIKRLTAEKVPYKLAISLHAPNDELRNKIIPQNRHSGISKILTAADHFFEATGRRVTYEYILIDGLNSELEHAQQLARLLRHRLAIVNLIPYNPIPELPYKTPSSHKIQQFFNKLVNEGIQVKIRYRKGDKINAACGQLRRSFRNR
ncbi:MAG: 23S rRNA (adenine(2503)-C(2))-methyltransferase RlmN [Planctomycetia bacterium]|nr:23S rRNA (adenine(2503)-C(2))-methyltransferase RlmN [Planctomycetia bacterium]